MQRRNKQSLLDKYDLTLFVDSGAPTLYNNLSKKIKAKSMGSTLKNRQHDEFGYVKMPEYIAYRKKYIQWLVENEQHSTIHSNLDVLHNARLTGRNQRLMEWAGLNPIPVYHIGTDEKYLKELVKRYDYISIGGMLSIKAGILIPILDRLFKEYILDKKGFPKVKVHGFACTSWSLMHRYPWYSVDSSTILRMSGYGEIAVKGAGSIIKRICISSRDVPLKSRISPGIIRAMEGEVAEYGFTISDLADDRIKRVAWNYISHAQHNMRQLPKWPWSMITQKSKKGAESVMRVYLAGSMGEESVFWDIVSKFDLGKHYRLISFYYKSALNELLKIKE